MITNRMKPASRPARIDGLKPQPKFPMPQKYTPMPRGRVNFIQREQMRRSAGTVANIPVNIRNQYKAGVAAVRQHAGVPTKGPVPQLR